MGYKKDNEWLNCAKNYRLAAKSYNEAFKYDTALVLSKIALNIASNKFSGKTKEEAFEKAAVLTRFGITNLEKYLSIGSERKLLDSTLNYYEDALNIVLMADSTEYLKLANIWDEIGFVYLCKANYNMAISFCNKALKYRLQLLGNGHPDVAKSYCNIGRIYVDRKNYKKAFEYNEKSLKIRIRKYGEFHPSVANSYYNLWYYYGKTGKIDSALMILKKWFKVGNFIYGTDSYRVGHSNYILARQYHNNGDFENALMHYKKTLELLPQNLFYLSSLNTYDFIGMIHSERGEFDKALENHLKSKAIIEKYYREDYIGIGISYIYIGMAYKDIGKYEQALDYYQKCYKFCKKVFKKETHGFAVISEKIGEIYKLKGNYDKAMEYFLNSLAIKKRTVGENSHKNYTIFLNIGDIYKYKGEYDKAMDTYEKSTKILIQTFNEKHHSVARNYNDIGEIYQKQKKYKKALEYYKKALQVLIDIYGKDNHNVAISYNNFAEIYNEMKNYDKALEFHQKALEIRLKAFGEKHPSVALSYNCIGKVYFNNGIYTMALLNFQRAMVANLLDFENMQVKNNPKQLSAISRPYLLQSLHSKAKTLAVENIESSLTTYDLLFKLIHEMRNDYNYENTRLMLSENSKGYFAEALSLLLKYGKKEHKKEVDSKIFEYFEKSKSASLSVYLSELEVRSYFNIDGELLEKEKEISIDRRYYETSLQKAIAKRSGYDTLKVQNYQNKLFHSSKQYDSLMVVFKNEYPDYFELKYKQQVANINTIQKKLNQNNALLNYFVADTFLFIAAITKDSVVYKTIKADSLFNQRIIDYHIDIKSDFSEVEKERSTYLYSYLIEPVEDLIKNKNELVIIPDGNLYYIPFETLCKSTTNPNDYLIKQYSITYHHSATLWLNSRNREQNITSNNFIGFAPVFDPKVNNGYMLSSEWISDTANIELATRSISSDLKHFNALPYSEKEIKSILKLFKKNGGKAEGYFHTEANEQSFKERTKDYKYVHVASHSFTNDKYPALSGIAFSQPDSTAQDNEDGILYAGESYNLNLSKADLVVLSSCKSGLGKLIKGEGFLSLSRGFLYSGVPNIVFSLWNVKDKPTKDLMVHFYKQILNGKSYSEALRKAKLKLIGNKKTAEPKYWAAWILVGE